MSQRRVEVVRYRNEWPKRFQEEAESLRKLFSPNDIKAYHIGSTSIPGISAKPIIDIILEVESLQIIDDNTRKLEEYGYIAKGENGIPGRRYFYKMNIQYERLVHLHCFKSGDENIQRHLSFRDYLIAHEDERERYSELKEELAKKYPLDIEAYINGKDQLVKELESKATDWQRART